MEWYLKVVRDNYANFEGRARRKEYWMFTLFNTLIVIGLMIVGGGLGSLMDFPQLGIILYAVYLIAVLVPTIGVVVRRLHDTGKSGWYYFVSLIPFIGGIWLLVLLVTEGDQGPNEYGTDPKAPNVEEISEIGKPDSED